MRKFLLVLLLATATLLPSPVHADHDGNGGDYATKQYCVTLPVPSTHEDRAYCLSLGWRVYTDRFRLDPNFVVRLSTLKHCEFDDGSWSIPCTWNVGTPIDGNGKGTSFYVAPTGNLLHVWRSTPAVGGWKWATLTQRRALVAKFGKTTTYWKRAVNRDAIFATPDGMLRSFR